MLHLQSACLKKYCECFQAGVFCNEACRCAECKNYEVRSSLCGPMYISCIPSSQCQGRAKHLACLAVSTLQIEGASCWWCLRDASKPSSLCTRCKHQVQCAQGANFCAQLLCTLLTPGLKAACASHGLPQHASPWHGGRPWRSESECSQLWAAHEHLHTGHK